MDDKAKMLDWFKGQLENAYPDVPVFIDEPNAAQPEVFVDGKKLDVVWDFDKGTFSVTTQLTEPIGGDRFDSNCRIFGVSRIPAERLWTDEKS